MRNIKKCTCGHSEYRDMTSIRSFRKTEKAIWEGEDFFCEICGDKWHEDGTIESRLELERKAEAMDYRAFVLIDNKYVEIELAPNGIKPQQCKTYWRFSRNEAIK